MRKIITLTMIKNESDIVEVFVRYTMNFAKKMIFIDNGCEDGSIEILKALIKEGFDLEIYTEAHQFYEQYLIENKYIKKIVSEYEFDFLLPLDVDEFLACDNMLIDRIELIPQDKITILNWKTYCILEDNTDGFFLDRITHVRLNEDKVFTKVMLPFDLLKDNQVLVTMGHHDIECINKVDKDYPEDIYIAHFPVRSMEQICLKIYQGTVAQLMSAYHCVIAFQWKKLQKEIRQKEFDLVKYSTEYALMPEQDREKIIYEEQKFDYSWCPIPVEFRYEDLQNRNIIDILYEMMQIIAIKSFIEEKNKGINVLIYGTGGTSKKLFQFIDAEKYNILAYIDSDEMKEYSQFQNKLILSPNKIKYINYDKIIIASNYYDEIYDVLLENGVSKERIISRFDVIEEQLIDNK